MDLEIFGITITDEDSDRALDWYIAAAGGGIGTALGGPIGGAVGTGIAVAAPVVYDYYFPDVAPAPGLDEPDDGMPSWADDPKIAWLMTERATREKARQLDMTPEQEEEAVRVVAEFYGQYHVDLAYENQSWWRQNVTPLTQAFASLSSESDDPFVVAVFRNTANILRQGGEDVLKNLKPFPNPWKPKPAPSPTPPPSETSSGIPGWMLMLAFATLGVVAYKEGQK